MADAYSIWRDAQDRSVAKTLRTIWPDLANALDAGAGGTGETAAQRRAKQPDCQIKGNHCAGKAAGVLEQSRRLTCIPCWGGHTKFVRNPEWTLQRNPRRPRQDPGQAFRELGGNWG